MQHSTVMDIPDTLEVIENAPDQKVALESYMTMNIGLQKFLKWYCYFDASKFQDQLNYVPSVTHTVQLISHLSDLTTLQKYPEAVQIRQLERLLSKLDPKGVLLLENCLTRDLKEYFPGIDWEYVNKTFNLSI